MREKWIRKPVDWFEKIEWRQFWSREQRWWLEKRFYFQDGKLPEHYTDEIAECLSDPALMDGGVHHSLKARYTHGIILCSCGRQVHLTHHWENPCQCGAEYDEDGGTLAPRSLWGEETGEVF